MTHLDPLQLRKQIKTVLAPVNLYSPEAEELLVATCAQESLMGTYRTQAPHGPARGIFQEEGNDFNDLVAWLAARHQPLLAWAQSLSTNFCVDDLVNNDQLAIAICRLHYFRCTGLLPAKTDLKALWWYHKVHYNSVGGAATQEEFDQHYKMFALTP